MVINSFEVNKNRIIVNGNKLGWVKLPDLFAYGTDDNTLQERFEMLYNDRVFKALNNEPDKLDNSNIKHSKPKKRRYTNRNNYKNINKNKDEELSFEEILSLIESKIDIWAEFVNNKYKDFSIADLDDIKQTIYLELLKDIQNRRNTEHYYCLNNLRSNLRYFTLSLSSKLNIFKGYLKLNIGQRDFDYILKIVEKGIELFNTDDLISNFNEKSRILSSETDINMDKVRYIMELYDAITNVDCIENYSNTANSEEETTEDISVNTIFKGDVQQLLDEKLTYKEKLVITERFGINDSRAKTLNEIGREFNVNSERIRQIEAKALRKLRDPSEAKKLIDYIRD